MFKKALPKETGDAYRPGCSANTAWPKQSQFWGLLGSLGCLSGAAAVQAGVGPHSRSIVPHDAEAGKARSANSVARTGNGRSHHAQRRKQHVRCKRPVSWNVLCVEVVTDGVLDSVQLQGTTRH
jgi:hypothetical protein